MGRFVRNPAFLPRVRENLGRLVVRAAEGVRDEARRLIDQSGGGEQYSHLPNRSSAPGEPPTSQSGELEEGLRATGPVISGSGNTISARAGNEHPKAMFLEWGTDIMEPRPHMRPALDNQRAAIVRTIAAPALLEGTQKP